MKAVKLYFSPTGSTKKIVDTIGKRFDGKSIDITLPKNRNQDIILDREDLLIIGLPVYAGRIPNVVTEQIKKIKGNNTPAVLVAVYGNRHYDDALLEMKDLIMEQGFLPFAAGAFIGQHSYTSKVGTGRPDKEDLIEAEAFSDKILKKLSDPSLIEVPGNRPYREGTGKSTFGPEVDDICLKCGICATKCPTGAIKFNRNIKIEAELCIKCHACVQCCPINAIGFGSKIDPIKSKLEDNFTSRREPEIFI